jgi:hypothetical protein
VVEHDRDGLAQDRVAEELEALVRGDAAVLIGIGAVGEGELEELVGKIYLQGRQKERPVGFMFGNHRGAPW